MSFITNMTNRVLKFVGIDSSSNNSKTHGNQIVSASEQTFNFDSENPVDEYVGKNNTTKNIENNIQTDVAIKNYQNNIKNICNKNNINATNVLKKLLDYTCMTKEAYNKLNNQEKLILWQGFYTIVQNATEVKNKYGLSSQASMDKIMEQMLDVYQSDQEHGNIIKADEVLHFAGDVNAEIKNNNLNNKSKKEKMGFFEKIYSSLRNKFYEYENKKLQNLTGEAKEKELSKIHRIQEKAEKIRLLHLNMTQDSELAYFGLTGAASKHLGWGVKALLDSRINKAERTRVADKIMTFDSQAEMLEQFCQRGDIPSEETTRAFVTNAVAEKSKEGVEEYASSYNEARSSGKYEILESNGLFTQMAGGIGAGTVLNSNMTNEEKSAFMNNFLANEEKFGDRDAVQQAINKGIKEYIQEYAKTHTKEEVSTLTKQIEETKSGITALANAEKTNNQEINKTIENKINNNQKKNNNTNNDNTTVIDYEIDDSQKSSITQSSTNPIKTSNDSPIIIKNKNTNKQNTTNSLKSLNINGHIAKHQNGSVDDIARLVKGGIPMSIIEELYPQKIFAQYCISDSNGAGALHRINDIIKSIDPVELAEWKTSTAGYNFIVNTLSTTDAEKYLKLKSVDFNLQKLAEKRIEDRKTLEHSKQGNEQNEAV